MNAKQYMHDHSKAEIETLCQKAGTSYGYFSQLAQGTRRPSVELAQALVVASNGKLDFVELLKTPKRTPMNRKARLAGHAGATP